MKNIAIATAIILSSSVALAEPHGYQLQVGSSELDPSIWDGPGHAPQPRTGQHFEPSLTAFYEEVDVEGSAAFAYVGSVEKSGPSRISLYEAQRGSPEATAYQDYYDRFPADTDWAAVADNWKSDPNNV